MDFTKFLRTTFLYNASGGCSWSGGLLDSRLWPEWSYELGSVRQSVLLSRSFLGIGSLVFSESQHDNRSLCVVVRDRLPDFLKKTFLSQKWGKWVKNGPKIGFLGFIGKFSH